MLRSAVERNLLRDERPLLLDKLQISSSNIGAQAGGVDTLKHLLGLSPDLPARTQNIAPLSLVLSERLLALVRPACDLVLRRIRSLKRCVRLQNDP